MKANTDHLEPLRGRRMILNLNEAIHLLVSDSPQRELRFEFEREIRLYQFQTWIYSPTGKMFWPKISGRLAATKFLERMEHEFLAARGAQRTTARRHRQLMNDERYASLYNSVIARYGGWGRLFKTPSAKEFDRRLAEQYDASKVVADLIAYRVRYLEHDGRDRNGASVNRSIFFTWQSKKGERGLSPRTIWPIWKEFKHSSIFIYLIEKQDFEFGPTRIQGATLLNELCEEAANLQMLRRFFGMYAHIAERFQHARIPIKTLIVPPMVDRIPPLTEPFSVSEQGILERYKLEYRNMNDPGLDG
jgi:hypothetical protein